MAAKAGIEPLARLRSGVLSEHSPSRSRSGTTRVSDEASNNERSTCDEPRHRIQMLLTAVGGRGMATSRARTIPLHPRHIEQKDPDARKQTEGGTPDSCPIPREQAEQRDRPNEYRPER